MTAMKVEIISRETIQPSLATPDHLKNFKICLLDELAPPSYVPILLLYSSDDFGTDFCLDNLKSSLSKTLTDFYPLCGKLKGNLSVDCSDDGAIYVEARVSVPVAEIVQNPETDLLYQLLPFDPYRSAKTNDEEAADAALVTGVQVNVFSCGGVGIGVCISHKVADGATMATFLNSWAAAAVNYGVDHQSIRNPPRLDSAMIFPPKGINLIKQSDMLRNDKVITKRFEFNGKNLSALKAKVAASGGNGANSPPPTRVEAVTSLIWKSAMEATRVNSTKETLPSSIATHLVNIRQRMNPPLPDYSVGNLWRLAIAPYMEAKKDVGLHELVTLLRKRIEKIDQDYVTKLQGENGFGKAIEPLMEMRDLALGGTALEVYTFSSWTRFPLYEVNFGWGRPTKVCTITVPVRNCVILMGTRNGDGIEAWVTLTEKDMAEVEANSELLQFLSNPKPITVVA